MKIRKLIQELQRLDQDSVAVIPAEAGYNYVESVTQKTLADNDEINGGCIGKYDTAYSDSEKTEKCAVIADWPESETPLMRR